MRSTFSGFYIARSGIQAARANLQITGQNMTNVNTEGYTRQRVDTSSIASVGNNMRYADKSDAAIGQGVSTNGTSQIRDPFLDVRYRRENAKVGDTSVQKDALGDVENLVDEVNNDGLDKQFKDLITQLQGLSKTPGDSVTESIVKTSSQMLLKMFNNTASQISDVKAQQLSYLKDTSIGSANQLLTNIANLNKEIKSADVSGSPALELLDSRNTMIDKLSQYANIEVDSNPVSIGSGRTVDELSINLVGKDGTKFNLVDDDKCAQFSLVESTATKPVTIKLADSTGTDVTTFSNDQLKPGSFHGYLAVINGKGTYDDTTDSLVAHDDTTSAKGIPYYQSMLDTLANKFASVMNTANSTDSTSKPMFTATDGTTTGATITAGNISISNAWNTASGSFITNTKTTLVPNVDTSKASDNILSMISLFSKSMQFTTPAGTLVFTGTMQDSVTNLSTTLGLQINDTTRQNDTFTSELSSISDKINANSAVSIDEEGINLIMYNQALSASSRFMSTLDQALDTIINKMGVS